MNNREWLYSLDVADLADWFDAEHVDDNDVLTRKSDVRADGVCANDGFMDLDSCTHGVRTFASETDSREKLEADVYRAADEMEEFTHGEKFINTNKILRWLDRQAAITEREFWECYANGNQWEAHQYETRCMELTAERDALARDLAECDESRIEFRDQRDHAEEMLAQMEKERDYWKLHADCWADKYKDMRTSRDCFKERAKRNEDKAKNYQRQLSKAERYGTIWPRWKDGAPIELPCAFEYMGNTERLQGIRFYSNAYVLEFTGIDHAKESFGIEYGTRHSRPPLIASDGKPILKGETLYGLSDSKAWTVTGFDRTRPWSVWAENGGGCKCLKPEWLAHEKPADGASAEKMAALEAENAELREKLGEAIGHAHEIGKLGDLEARAG